MTTRHCTKCHELLDEMSAAPYLMSCPNGKCERYGLYTKIYLTL